MLIGAVYSQPDGDIREHIDKIEHAEVHDNLMESYNSSFEGIEDQAGSSENREYASYGVVMLGLILIILSFMKKKGKDSGLLYQKGDKHRISPKDLEKSITRSNSPPDLPPAPILPVGSPASSNPSSATPANGSSSYDAYELPSLGDSGSMLSPTPGLEYCSLSCWLT